MRWSTGEATVHRLLQQGGLEWVHGAQADGGSWLVRARRGLTAAQIVVDAVPECGVILAADAARQACLALLAQQGLRPTAAGGHAALEEATRAQFGETLRGFGGLSRRRYELEYPLYPGETARASEAVEAVKIAAEIVDTAAQLIPTLAFF